MTDLDTASAKLEHGWHKNNGLNLVELLILQAYESWRIVTYEFVYWKSQKEKSLTRIHVQEFCYSNSTVYGSRSMKMKDLFVS